MPKTLPEVTPRMQAYVDAGGFLYNPATGRTFQSNIYTILRPDLQWVSGPNPTADELKPTVTRGDAGGLTGILPQEEVHIGGADAGEALDGVLKKLAEATTKSDMRNIGKELGLTLDKNMRLADMRTKIQEHITSLKAMNL